MVILANLVFGVQGFSQMNSKEFEKVMAKVAKEYDKGNKQRALSMLKEDIQKNPSNIILKVMLGMFYNDMGRKNESEKELNEAVELQQKYPFIADDGEKYDIRLMIGALYMSQEEYEKALKWISRTDNTNFEKIDEVDFLMGILNYRLENIEDAKKYFLKYYNKDTEGNSENVLRMIYYDEGNHKEAIKQYLAAIQKGNLWAYDNLAVLYLNLGDYDASEKLVRKGLELARKENDTEEIKELEETLDIIREARQIYMQKK